MKEFNKNTYLIILTVLTVVCVIAGAFIHLGGLHFNGFGKNGERANKHNSNTVTTSGELNEFASVDVNVDLLKLDMVYGDKFGYTYEGISALEPKFECTEGKLKITQGKVGDRELFGNTKPDCHCTLVVPNGTELSDVKIDVNVGDILISDLTIDNLTIDADLGNVGANNSNLGRVVIDADLGNIEFSKCSGDYVKCEADLGNIEIDGKFGEIVALAELGNIEIDGECDRIDAGAEVGNVEINGQKYGKSYRK